MEMVEHLYQPLKRNGNNIKKIDGNRKYDENGWKLYGNS